jgi:hypothetical protein
MALKPVARAAHALARPVFKRFGISEGAIAENWAEIVGAEWAVRASPRHFNRQSQTLTLRVAGAHALELAHLEREMIARINGFAGRDLVKRLKLVQGPVTPRPADHFFRIPPPSGRGPGGGMATSPGAPGLSPALALPQRGRGFDSPASEGKLGGECLEERGHRRCPGGPAGIQSEALKSALATLGRAIRARVLP